MLCKDAKQAKTQDETQVFQELKNKARIRGSIIQCLKNARKKFVQLKMLKEWRDNKDKHRHLIQQFRSLQARIYQELSNKRNEAYKSRKLFTKSKLLKKLITRHTECFQNLREIVKRNCNQAVLGMINSLEIDMLVGCGYSITGHCLACFSHVDYNNAITRLDGLQSVLSVSKFKKQYDLKLATQEIKAIKNNYIEINALCRDLDGYCGCTVDDNSTDDTKDPIGINELRYLYDHLDVVIRNIQLVPIDENSKNMFEYLEYLLNNDHTKPSIDSIRSWINILNTSKAVSILPNNAIEISKQDIDTIISKIDIVINKLNDGFVKSIIGKMNIILNDADRRYMLDAHKAGFIANISDAAVYIASHRIVMCILDAILKTTSRDRAKLMEYINCISFMLDYIDRTNQSSQDKDATLVKYKDLRHYPCYYHGEAAANTIRHDTYFITNHNDSDALRNKCDEECEWCAHLYPYGYRNYYSYGSGHAKYNEISEAAIIAYENIGSEVGAVVDHLVLM